MSDGRLTDLICHARIAKGITLRAVVLKMDTDEFWPNPPKKRKRYQTMKIDKIAEQLGESLTKNGNLLLGSDDQGVQNPPGGSMSYREVNYYLLADGEYRVSIDDRHGNNQGYFQQNGGTVETIDAETLDEAIALAKEHVDGLDDDALVRAHRIASAAARKTQRKIDEMEDDTISFTITVPRTQANAIGMVDSLIELERNLRAQAKADGKPGCKVADDLAIQRRQLQEDMGLVLTHAQIDQIAREQS